MKKILSLATLATVIVFLGTSCEKTVEKEVIVLVNDVDTTLTLTANNWNCFGYNTVTLLDTGSTTYFTTNEGVKFKTQAYRLGSRIQTKSEFGFHNKVLYFKWKGQGDGDFAAFLLQIKYDILSTDSTPAIQGVDLTNFTSGFVYNGSTLLQNDTWYYTRIAPVAGTDNYQVTTSLNNYSNSGGTVVVTNTVPIYTKSGYLAFRVGDPYSLNAYGVLGEAKIASN